MRRYKVFEPRGLVRRRAKPYIDIWRQPYSEKELQGSGFELACAEGSVQHTAHAGHMAAAIQRKGAAKQRI